MGFRLWKQGKTADFHMIDRQVGDQYRIAGVDAWLYTYEGPDGNGGSTDLTKPDYTKTNPLVPLFLSTHLNPRLRKHLMLLAHHTLK